MSQDFELVTIYRVYDTSQGVCLEVRPHPDGLGFELRTPDEASKVWYGNISLTLTPQQALKLGEALTKSACY